MASGAGPLGQEPGVQQLDGDLVDAAAAPGPAGHVVGEERLVAVGQGVHQGLGGPPGEVLVEQPRGREVPGMLDDLAGVVGHQVAVAAGDRGRPAQRTARLLVEEPGQEEPLAPEAECGDQLGQPRVLSEPLGRLGRIGHGVLGSLLDWVEARRDRRRVLRRRSGLQPRRRERRRRRKPELAAAVRFGKVIGGG
jgi:hypothetical protein